MVYFSSLNMPVAAISDKRRECCGFNWSINLSIHSCKWVLASIRSLITPSIINAKVPHAVLLTCRNYCGCSISLCWFDYFLGKHLLNSAFPKFFSQHSTVGSAKTGLLISFRNLNQCLTTYMLPIWPSHMAQNLISFPVSSSLYAEYWSEFCISSRQSCASRKELLFFTAVWHNIFVLRFSYGLR